MNKNTSATRAPMQVTLFVDSPLYLHILGKRMSQVGVLHENARISQLIPADDESCQRVKQDINFWPDERKLYIVFISETSRCQHARVLKALPGKLDIKRHSSSILCL